MTQQASARRLASAAAQAAREAGQQAAREAQQASAPVQTAPTGEWELWVVLQGAQGWAAGTAAAALTSQTLEGQNPQQARQNPQEMKVEGCTMWVLHFQLKVGVGSAFFSRFPCAFIIDVTIR